MNGPIPLDDGIFWVGVNDRETDLFEGLWPLPGGISYNAYVIADEKSALVDTVREPYLGEYLEKVRRALPAGKEPEFLVINHIEPDHSGCLRTLLRIFPRLTIVGNRWTLRLLEQYHGISTGTRLVADGDVVDLGRRSVRMLLTPMVHWPETMVSCETTSGVLFTGDLFGGYGALAGGIFDEEMRADDLEGETRRYFSNVLGKFSPMVRKALDRVGELEHGTVAPAHGPLWRKDPGKVKGWFERWSRHEGEPGAVVAYGSMYGNTKHMAEAVQRGLVEGGAGRIAVHDLSRSHLSYVLSDAWRFGGLALGCATYNTGLFPPMAALVSLLADKALSNRVVGLFGSFGWTGGAVAGLRDYAAAAKLTVAEPVVEVKGGPSGEDLSQCRGLGLDIARRVAGGA